MMTEKQAKETYLLRTRLDADNRLFVCDEKIKATYGKAFKEVNPDVRLLLFVNDKVAMTSDCFILYAIAHLGCPTKEAIIAFLNAIHAKAPDLNIVLDIETVSARIIFLRRNGFIARFFYSVAVGKEQQINDVSMYTLTEDSFNMVKQHLRKRITLNSNFHAKQINELIGWSSAAYVGTMLARLNRGFVEFTERMIRTKEMGALFFSCEWIANVGENSYYVAFMPSFLEFDKSYMTERDYERVCAVTVNTVRNYINCRSNRRISYVVIVVSDNADLNNIAFNIMATGIMDRFLDNIFFTGEGIFRSATLNPKRAFCRICIDPQNEAGYSICATEAPFMEV